LEVALEKKIEAVDGIDIKWIADGEDQTTFAKGHGNDLEASRVRRANLRNDFGRNNDPGEIDPVHLRLGREGARNVVGRNNPITNQDIDDTGSAIKCRARLSDLLTRNQPDFFEHFQHIIVVSLQGELIPVMPFKRTNLALRCQRASRFIRSTFWPVC